MIVLRQTRGGDTCPKMCLGIWGLHRTEQRGRQTGSVGHKKTFTVSLEEQAQLWLSLRARAKSSPRTRKKKRVKGTLTYVCKCSVWHSAWSLVHLICSLAALQGCTTGPFCPAAWPPTYCLPDQWVALSRRPSRCQIYVCQIYVQSQTQKILIVLGKFNIRIHSRRLFFRLKMGNPSLTVQRK